MCAAQTTMHPKSNHLVLGSIALEPRKASQLDLFLMGKDPPGNLDPMCLMLQPGIMLLTYSDT
eukprot:7803461-Ditylum_brightwellii.AAC.1